MNEYHIINISRLIFTHYTTPFTPITPELIVFIFLTHIHPKQHNRLD